MDQMVQLARVLQPDGDELAPFVGPIEIALQPAQSGRNLESRPGVVGCGRGHGLDLPQFGRGGHLQGDPVVSAELVDDVLDRLRHSPALSVAAEQHSGHFIVVIHQCCTGVSFLLEPGIRADVRWIGLDDNAVGEGPGRHIRIVHRAVADDALHRSSRQPQGPAPLAHLEGQAGRLVRCNGVGTLDETDLMDLRHPFLASVHPDQRPIELSVVVAGHTETDLIVAALGRTLLRIGLTALSIQLEDPGRVDRMEAGHRHDPLGVAGDAGHESQSTRHRRSSLRHRAGSHP